MKWKYATAVSIRLAVIFVIIPSYPEDYFVPFLNSLSSNLDIWSNWLDTGGDDRSFPYGIAMLLAYIPSLIFSHLLQLFPFDPTRSLEIAIGVQFLAIESLLWRHLERSKSLKKSLNIFLFSPLIIWVNYFLGLNDFFPSACLFFASYLLLSHRYRSAGIWMGIAIGMKFSLALILPFLILFAWDNPRFKKNIWITALISLGVGAIAYLPGVYSTGFREMVFNNKESIKAIGYFLILGEEKLLVMPLIYLFLLYWIWRAGRISMDVLVAFFGIALFLISSFSPASIGWMLWGLPLMFMNLAKESKSRINLYIIQILFLSNNVLTGIEVQTLFGSFRTFILPSVVKDLLFTFAIVLVTIWSYSSLKAAIRHGDRYKIAKAPLTISIAGDSGTGKDTLTNALTALFDPKATSVLTGDDYHKYERGDESWKNTTHLNPTANYLDLWERDYKLAYNREYFEQREYNHETGKFSKLKPRLRRDILISQGLHALYSNLSEHSDLRVFLSMEDELRINLKIKRDHEDRRQSLQTVLDTIKKRENDYLSFIAPQKSNSHVHFHLFQRNEGLDIRVSAKSNFMIDNFMNALASNFDIEINRSTNFDENIYEISSSNVQIQYLKKILKDQISEYDQLFFEQPKIPEGALGIMTVLTVILVTNIRQTSDVKTT